MPKVVIDTSVFIAGLFTKHKQSNTARTISLWREGAFTLVMSPQIFRELVATLYDKGFSDELVSDFAKTIAKIGLLIPGACETSRLNKIDPSDNIFLAAAYESQADYIVSLDKKSLLPMKHFHGTTIYTPQLFVRALMLPVAEQAQEALAQEVHEQIDELRKETWSRTTKVES